MSISWQVKPRAEKPAKAKVEEDPEERLDDDFLAEVFASAEDEVDMSSMCCTKVGAGTSVSQEQEGCCIMVSELTTAKNRCVSF